MNSSFQLLRVLARQCSQTFPTTHTHLMRGRMNAEYPSKRRLDQKNLENTAPIKFWKQLGGHGARGFGLHLLSSIIIGVCSFAGNPGSSLVTGAIFLCFHTVYFMRCSIWNVGNPRKPSETPGNPRVLASEPLQNADSKIIFREEEELPLPLISGRGNALPPKTHFSRNTFC